MLIGFEIGRLPCVDRPVPPRGNLRATALADDLKDQPNMAWSNPIRNLYASLLKPFRLLDPVTVVDLLGQLVLASAMTAHDAHAMDDARDCNPSGDVA